MEGPHPAPEWVPCEEQQPFTPIRNDSGMCMPRYYYITSQCLTYHKEKLSITPDVVPHNLERAMAYHTTETITVMGSASIEFSIDQHAMTNSLFQDQWLMKETICGELIT